MTFIVLIEDRLPKSRARFEAEPGFFPERIVASGKEKIDFLLQERKNFIPFLCSIINPMKTRQNQLFANAAPLGLYGFAMTTLLLNIQNAGFFSLSVMIMSMGIFFGGIEPDPFGWTEFRVS